MSVLRQLNVLGQMRVDAPHIRAIESSIAADFDLLAGAIMAGARALVVRGFELEMATALSNPATSLQLAVAGGMLMHPLASEAGTIFAVASDADAEVLSVANDRVVGGFTASTTNYVGLDLRREAADETSDTVMFLGADTKLETPRTVPLGRLLDYRIVISTTDFSSTPHICPVAKVVTNADNTVASIVDCRDMFFRLGTGGTTPDRLNTFAWTDGRKEATTGTGIFGGGDKLVGSLKDDLDSMKTRLWELGGGEYWYSPTADRELRLAYGQPALTDGSNFSWNLGSSTLTWQSLSVIFANSTGWYNRIVDGNIVLADGECAYVDIDRTQNLTGGSALVMSKIAMTQLGATPPTIPGSRIVVAWRIGNYIWAKDSTYEVGRGGVGVATTTFSGTVKLSYAAGTPSDPVVVPLKSTGGIDVTAVNSNGDAVTATAHGSGTGLVGIGGSSSGTGITGIGGASNGLGVYGQGDGAGSGVFGAGGETGSGVDGIGGSSGGAGITGTGLAPLSVGVYGVGGAGGAGVYGVGNAAAAGILGDCSVGTSNASGVEGRVVSGASGGSAGVRGDGQAYGDGGNFTTAGDATNDFGVVMSHTNGGYAFRSINKARFDDNLVITSTSKHVTYSSPKTGYIWVLASEFNIGTSTAIGLSSEYAVITATDTAGVASSFQIRGLPAGATVSSVELYIDTSEAAASASAVLTWSITDGAYTTGGGGSATKKWLHNNGLGAGSEHTAVAVPVTQDGTVPHWSTVPVAAAVTSARTNVAPADGNGALYAVVTMPTMSAGKIMRLYALRVTYTYNDIRTQN